MKILRHLCAILYRNVIRQKGVKAPAHMGAIHRIFRMEIYAEHICVNAGIRPRAAFNIRAFFKEHLHCVLQRFANRGSVFLHLKTVVCSAFICKGKKNVSQSTITAGPNLFSRMTPASAAAMNTAAAQSLAEMESCFSLVLPSPPR